MFDENDELELEPEVKDDDIVIEEIQEETPAPDEKESEKESYSRRVQKKIDKLVYERNIEKEARARETAELKAEIEALKQSNAERQQERANQTLEQKRQELLSRRRDALEISDWDDVNRIDDELMDIKIQEKQKPEPVKRQEPEKQEEPEPQINTALSEWQQKNKWVFDSNQKSRLDKANKILQDIIADGYDLDDPDTYVQLDKKLKRETPPPGNGPDRGQVSESGNATFTARDKQKMIDWGLDPNDPKHRAEWIKNKVKDNG